jgi:GTPase SAR1 family protein
MLVCSHDVALFKVKQGGSISQSIQNLVDRIIPENTILLLGAGASIESGAPSGTSLARGLAGELNPSPDGDDLAEIASIYENRLGRRPLVASIRSRLGGLEPSGALLALPTFEWNEVYTTNFDRLLEESYSKSGIDHVVIRSNYDFSSVAHESAIKLMKIHGCISQDIADGHRGRMLLTERDYDEVASYREALFQALKFKMMICDTLIIGQSLRDSHLRDLAKHVANLRDKSGTPGEIFLLSYEKDPDRAQLLEQKGFQVTFGGLGDFVYALAQKEKGQSKLVFHTDSADSKHLPRELATTTIDVTHAASLGADAVRLFNGSAATYGDIAAGLTIRRAVEQRLLDIQQGPKGIFLVLTGVAGVGKTCLARRLLYQKSREGYQCWEHRSSFPLDVDAWLAVENRLRQAGEQAVLLVDDCTERLASLNSLVNALGKLEESSLRLILTANSHQWQTRNKSPFFFSKGTKENLSQLAESDMEELVNLVERQPNIRSLVEQTFALLTRPQRIRHLRDRCSAEMYVCLKNIFGSARLDDILLREYAELNREEQDIYRHVAVLQSMGCKVHRQLILRVLEIESGHLSSMLELLDGIVSEYDINPRQGLYGWTTRHDVVADAISTYKFADAGELRELLDRLIDGINPTVWLELETVRAICTTDWGISHLPDAQEQIQLLKKVISIVPAERTPRRRLIRRFLDLGDLDSAEQEMTRVKAEIGQDDIIERYRALLYIQRAETTAGILNEDRLAMLQSARNQVLRCIENFPGDRFNYRTFADVGVSIARYSGDLKVLDEAIERMKHAESSILDPELMKDRRRYEQVRRNYAL